MAIFSSNQHMCYLHLQPLETFLRFMSARL